MTLTLSLALSLALTHPLTQAADLPPPPALLLLDCTGHVVQLEATALGVLVHLPHIKQDTYLHLRVTQDGVNGSAVPPVCTVYRPHKPLLLAQLSGNTTYVIHVFKVTQEDGLERIGTGSIKTRPRSGLKTPFIVNTERELEYVKLYKVSDYCCRLTMAGW